MEGVMKEENEKMRNRERRGEERSGLMSRKE